MKIGIPGRENCMCKDSEVGMSMIYLKREALCRWYSMTGQEECKRRREKQAVAISLGAETCGSLDFIVGIIGDH